MSIFKKGIFFGIAVCDISTGDFYSAEIKEENNFERLLDEISRYSPSEIIANEMLYDCGEEISKIKERFDVYISTEDEEKFSEETEEIYMQYALSDDKGNIIKDLEKRPFAVAAINGLIKYIEDTQKTKLEHINKITIYTITKYMSALKPFIKPGCIITDVGSVKGNIHKAAHELGLDSCFIGGHPMAGSELSGYANSSADILKDSKYVITPTADTSSESLESYVQLIKDMKAVPVIMDYKEHDYTVAAISHVPHLIAAGLTRTVKTNDDDEKHMHLLAAGGFRDTTRIAASSPEMWSQICNSNKDSICTFLDKFIEEMHNIRDNISNDTPEETSEFIENLFKEAGGYRKSF